MRAPSATVSPNLLFLYSAPPLLISLSLCPVNQLLIPICLGHPLLFPSTPLTPFLLRATSATFSAFALLCFIFCPSFSPCVSIQAANMIFLPTYSVPSSCHPHCCFPSASLIQVIMSLFFSCCLSIDNSLLFVQATTLLPPPSQHPSSGMGHVIGTPPAPTPEGSHPPGPCRLVCFGSG